MSNNLWFRALARIGSALNTSLLTQDCYLCAMPSGEDPLCGACIASLPTLPKPHCPICALPTPAVQVCGACLKQAPHFDATFALYRYDFPLDRLIQAFKFQHRLALGAWFSQSLQQLSPPDVDIIIPLPLSTQRLRERGFNQAAELCRSLTRASGVKIDMHSCQRAHQSVPQSLLPWKMRHKNVRHAFDCLADFAGKHVLVVDDVMTTGATVNEFARILKRQGASRVSNLVIARALKP